MSEPAPPRGRRGRPALSDGHATTSVNVRLPPQAYDRAHAQARAERRTVPDLMRRAVARYLAAPPEDDDDG